MSDIIKSHKVRTRNWFITINPDAECYINFKEILSSYKCNHYAYIYHKADEENKNDNHIHLALELVNARPFDAIQSKFVGAHIEMMKFKNQSYKYLIHKENDNKIKYDIKEVVTDSLDYYNIMINTDEYEQLTTENIILDLSNGFQTITEFFKKYGLNQVSTKIGVLSKLLIENTLCDRIKILEEENVDLKGRLGESNFLYDELKEKYIYYKKEYEKIKGITDEDLPF